MEKKISNPETSKKSVTKRKPDKNVVQSNKNAKKAKEDIAKPNLNSEVPLKEIDFSCSKLNKKGEKHTLKIVSWNVAGLRACIKKNGVEYLKAEDADIYCLQEVKCTQSQLPGEINQLKHHIYWCAGSVPGYAGVGLLTKKKPLKVTYGVGEPEYDREGRVITAEFDNFYLVNVYATNAGRGLKTLPKRILWQKLMNEKMKNLNEKKPVIITGDFNVAHTEIDLANPATNERSAGFTIEERNMFSELLALGYADSFRQLYPDKTGAYTFWSYFANARPRNTGWRLDYFLVSNHLMDLVCDNVMRNNIVGSDHCPIALFIKLDL